MFLVFLPLKMNGNHSTVFEWERIGEKILHEALAARLRCVTYKDSLSVRRIKKPLGQI